MKFTLFLLFSLLLIHTANAKNLKSYVDCLKAINHPQWFLIMDDKAKMLDEDEGLFIGKVGKQQEPALVVINDKEAFFYPIRLAGKKEYTVMGIKWINTLLNINFKGKVFSVRIQERLNDSVFTEIMVISGKVKDDFYPFKDVKEEILSGENLKDFLPQADNILAALLEQLPKLQKIYGKINNTITESCSSFYKTKRN